MTTVDLRDYTSTFVQRIPKYIIKNPGAESWSTVKGALTDKTIEKHLEGKLCVGSLGKWYPGHALLDFDQTPYEQVEEIRDGLGMDKSNSALYSSESDDSYHLFVRPSYREMPPTLNLVQEILVPYCRERGVEVYPSGKKCVRLPFGKVQKCLDEGSEFSDTWEGKMYWFLKLDEFELLNVPKHQQQFDFTDPEKRKKLPAFIRGKELLEYGLPGPSSRNESQFHVLYYLWRKNVPPDTARKICWDWIQAKHNGYSREIRYNPHRVREEIKRQTQHIWNKYSAIAGMLPDEAHLMHFGYVTKEDLKKILHLCDASLPKSRFLFNLLKYTYPRKHRDRIGVHSDLLKMWASRDAYLNRLEELRQMGVLLERDDRYIVNLFSKAIKMKWDYQSQDDAILVDDRPPETIEESLAAVFAPEELRTVLTQAGMSQRVRTRYLNQVFSPPQTPPNPPGEDNYMCTVSVYPLGQDKIEAKAKAWIKNTEERKC